MRCFAWFAILLLSAAPLAAAQSARPGRLAGTVNGQTGQRQTSMQSAQSLQPTGRVSGRIGNRVQSRIRNRIDRYYNPQGNAAAPFAIADEQLRSPNRQRRTR